MQRPVWRQRAFFAINQVYEMRAFQKYVCDRQVGIDYTNPGKARNFIPCATYLCFSIELEP